MVNGRHNNTIIESVESNLSRVDETFRSRRFLLAVSGGVDSVVLAHVFKRLGLEFGIVHCNFQLRQAQSNLDESFVKNLAEELSAVCHCKKMDTQSALENNTKSIQMVARDLRYTYFEELVKENDYDYIVTAHHLGDNIETLLLNLSRGTGISGLKGIDLVSNKRVRPMLSVTKNELYEFALSLNLEWREDASNQSSKYKRNLIRNKVVPSLQQLNPNFDRVMEENIKKFQAYNANIKKQVSSFSAKLVQDKEVVFIPFSSLSLDAIILYEYLKEFGFSFSDAEEVLKKTGVWQVGKKIQSSGYELIYDRNDWLLVLKNSVVLDDLVHLTLNQEVEYQGKRYLLEEIENDAADFSDKDAIYLSPEQVKLPLTVRVWQKGDRIIPFGMQGSKKVSDILTDAKIGAHVKASAQVVLSDKDVVWVTGVRSSNTFRVDLSLNSLYKLSCR